MLFSGRNIAHLTHALMTLIIASAARLKTVFVNEKYTRTHCSRAINVPDKFSSAIVIPTMRGECATHLNCSHLIHTCLQSIIRFSGDGELRYG